MYKCEFWVESGVIRPSAVRTSYSRLEAASWRHYINNPYPLRLNREDAQNTRVSPYNHTNSANSAEKVWRNVMRADRSISVGWEAVKKD